METQLREFISTILTPFNDRVTSIELEQKGTRAREIVMRDRLGQIEKKIDSEVKLRDTVADIDSSLLALVSLTKF